MILIEENYPLQSLNTFGIKAFTRFFAEATTPDDMRTIIRIFNDYKLPKLIMGGGSNLLFKRDFEGIIYYPSIHGIEIVDMDNDHVWVKAWAGENWDKFVAYCVGRNWGGAENLSLIPGNVGACPIQNIGAYGVEVKDIIETVETIDIINGSTRIFSNNECQFGYRDSIFKNEYKDKYLVIAVTFRLNKNPIVNKNYKDVLEEIDKFDTISIFTVRQAIINIRNRKLPDPAKLGNAGSFFKNPIIDEKVFHTLKDNYPEIPFFVISESSIKIPAAWLIQNAGWKGVREGNTGTHPTQPLVIVNYGGADGKEIVDFAEKIQKAVLKTFGIELEMEVKLI